MEIFLENTASGKREIFKPLKDNEVGLYTCGPTVYNFAHVGNLRSYVFADVLRRTLEYNNFKVKQIVNITDIGHLASDADEGEDKMTKALKREGKPMTLKAMRELADHYFAEFKRDLTTLNIEMPDEFPFASDHIEEDIEIVKKLQERGFTYSTSDGIYFSVDKFPNYGRFANVKSGFNDEEKTRIGINPEKINQRDFAVWKFNKELGYDAPFGKGFPGWHIECSAMSHKYLGQPFDIHTGGIDHVPIHHTNEIAQSEAAYDKPLANYWIHNAHYNIGEAKMAKSGENFITLQTLLEKKIKPLALRYVFLGARYSSPITFSFDSLEGADSALRKLRQRISNMPATGKINYEYKERFLSFVNDNLDTARAVALVWDLLRDENITEEDKKATVLDFDRVLGLRLGEKEEFEIPEVVSLLIEKRDKAREDKDFKTSDKLRDEIESLGFEVKDTENGTVVSPK